MKKLISFPSSIVLGLLIFSAVATAPSAAPAAARLSVHQDVVGPLLVPGDRVEIAYEIQGTKSPVGSIYVRDDLQQGFERLPLKLKRYTDSTFQAVVPAGLIRGHRLLYYAVVRDPGTGRTVTVPAGGAHSPQSVLVLDRPVIVKLGTHRFGHTHAPGAVVARARPEEVGWLNEPGDHAGPETFLVGRDRSIWLHDEVNHRLLAWRPGRPDTIARTVMLPFVDALDVAIGPAGTSYLTRGLPNPPRQVLYHLSAAGKVRWQTTLTGRGEEGCGLSVGPDGTLYCVYPTGGSEYAWVPMATPTGRLLSPAQQRRRTLTGEPVAGGLRLLSETYAPHGFGRNVHELRYALIDRGDRLVRAWRVLSRSTIGGVFAAPALVGGDPVVALDVSAGTPGGDYKVEHVVLRLAANGTRTRLSLPIAVYGDNPAGDLRLGPDGKLYQLATSPATGVVIRRDSLGRLR